MPLKKKQLRWETDSLPENTIESLPIEDTNRLRSALSVYARDTNKLRDLDVYLPSFDLRDRSAFNLGKEALGSIRANRLSKSEKTTFKRRA